MMSPAGVAAAAAAAVSVSLCDKDDIINYDTHNMLQEYLRPRTPSSIGEKEQGEDESIVMMPPRMQILASKHYLVDGDSFVSDAIDASGISTRVCVDVIVDDEDIHRSGEDRARMQMHIAKLAGKSAVHCGGIEYRGKQAWVWSQVYVPGSLEPSPNGIAGIRLQERELAAVLVGVLLCLHDMHSHNILHRDVRARHIFIDDKSVCARLGGFRVAALHACDVQHHLGKRARRICWTAPELLNDSTAASTASDVWSVGATAIELLCGFPPFADGKHSPLSMNVESVLQHHVKHSSMQLQNFIAQCARRIASQRSTIEQLLCHSFLADVDVQTDMNALIARIRTHGAPPPLPSHVPGEQCDANGGVNMNHEGQINVHEQHDNERCSMRFPRDVVSVSRDESKLCNDDTMSSRSSSSSLNVSASSQLESSMRGATAAATEAIESLRTSFAHCFSNECGSPAHMRIEVERHIQNSVAQAADRAQSRAKPKLLADCSEASMLNVLETNASHQTIAAPPMMVSDEGKRDSEIQANSRHHQRHLVSARLTHTQHRRLIAPRKGNTTLPLSSSNEKFSIQTLHRKVCSSQTPSNISVCSNRSGNKKLQRADTVKQKHRPRIRRIVSTKKTQEARLERPVKQLLVDCENVMLRYDTERQLARQAAAAAASLMQQQQETSEDVKTKCRTTFDEMKSKPKLRRILRCKSSAARFHSPNKHIDSARTILRAQTQGKKYHSFGAISRAEDVTISSYSALTNSSQTVKNVSTVNAAHTPTQGEGYSELLSPFVNDNFADGDECASVTCKAPIRILKRNVERERKRVERRAQLDSVLGSVSNEILEVKVRK